MQNLQELYRQFETSRFVHMAGGEAPNPADLHVEGIDSQNKDIQATAKPETANDVVNKIEKNREETLTHIKGFQDSYDDNADPTVKVAVAKHADYIRDHANANFNKVREEHQTALSGLEKGASLSTEKATALESKAKNILDHVKARLQKADDKFDQNNQTEQEIQFQQQMAELTGQNPEKAKKEIIEDYIKDKNIQLPNGLDSAIISAITPEQLKVEARFQLEKVIQPVIDKAIAINKIKELFENQLSKTNSAIKSELMPSQATIDIGNGNLAKADHIFEFMKFTIKEGENKNKTAAIIRIQIGKLNEPPAVIIQTGEGIVKFNNPNKSVGYPMEAKPIQNTGETRFQSDMEAYGKREAALAILQEIDGFPKTIDANHVFIDENEAGLVAKQNKMKAVRMEAKTTDGKDIYVVVEKTATALPGQANMTPAEKMNLENVQETTTNLSENQIKQASEKIIKGLNIESNIVKNQITTMLASGELPLTKEQVGKLDEDGIIKLNENQQKTLAKYLTKGLNAIENYDEKEGQIIVDAFKNDAMLTGVKNDAAKKVIKGLFDNAKDDSLVQYLARTQKITKAPEGEKGYLFKIGDNKINNINDLVGAEKNYLPKDINDQINKLVTENPPAEEINIEGLENLGKDALTSLKDLGKFQKFLDSNIENSDFLSRFGGLEGIIKLIAVISEALNGGDWETAMAMGKELMAGGNPEKSMSDEKSKYTEILKGHEENGRITIDDLMNAYNNPKSAATVDLFKGIRDKDGKIMFENGVGKYAKTKLPEAVKSHLKTTLKLTTISIGKDPDTELMQIEGNRQDGERVRVTLPKIGDKIEPRVALMKKVKVDKTEKWVVKGKEETMNEASITAKAIGKKINNIQAPVQVAQAETPVAPEKTEPPESPKPEAATPKKEKPASK